MRGNPVNQVQPAMGRCAWLDPSTEHPAELAHIFDNGALKAYPVSTYVNDPKNDSAEAVLRSSTL